MRRSIPRCAFVASTLIAVSVTALLMLPIGGGAGSWAPPLGGPGGEPALEATRHAMAGADEESRVQIDSPGPPPISSPEKSSAPSEAVLEVRDFDDRPVAGARVRYWLAGDQLVECATDASGSAILKVRPGAAGVVRGQVAHESFKDTHFLYPLADRPSKWIVRLEWRHAAEGIVTDAFGNPIAGAAVRVFQEDGATAAQAVTGNGGRFLLRGLHKAVPGPLIVAARKDGVGTARLEISSAEAPAMHLALKGDGKIRGMVTNASGLPVRDVRMAALERSVLQDSGGTITNATLKEAAYADAGTGSYLGYGASNDHGEFAICGLDPTREFVLFWSGAREQGTWGPFQPGITNVQISLDVNEIQIRVVDSSGIGVPEAFVRFSEVATGRDFASGFSDESGLFRCTLRQIEPVRVSVSGDKGGADLVLEEIAVRAAQRHPHEIRLR